MSSTITAGNATNGLAISADNTGILELKTGTGAGTTALTLSTAQAATFAGTVTAATGTLYPIVSGTTVATTSGTSIDFTGIPSWVKRITLMFNGVSTNGTNSPIVQIGISTGVETTGYISTSCSMTNGATPSSASSTAGYVIRSQQAANVISGHMVITLMGSNLWISSHAFKQDTTTTMVGAGDKTLAGTLDRVRLTTTTGVDTFDAGSINILYE